MSGRDEQPQVPPSILAAAGDPVEAEELRRAFVVIRDSSSNPELADLAKRVLDGRMSYREFGRTQTFDQEAGRALQTFGEEWQALSEDEREELAARGRAEEQRLADELRDRR
ncbi:hypothetical protein H5V45_13365 [Nocardioides sp. KIGAM211]|uniref:Uncharacterized protein n=1 Tax=Nocardioides luti TaxID=2761101 RepID=A0A7X0RJP4_9ACTN|nr:hypothetical protein [Nocardioides luti]MBB6628309.1 hypothetical protein [Nocardioides luti]